ncbi:PepSY domain-containing protein [Paracoccus lutimaris]|uniref:PepSY domain-containing protein n=1 Tax=Paracoccus lutimaris TaxID=1490030 RepID=A0A368Z688_9RHOB|nr:PepSY domain-containing protein [Paracoccus lutimaris]RCW87016.1 hypothetical protein DFP89_10320 [Paracoccus lutimaris]
MRRHIHLAAALLVLGPSLAQAQAQVDADRIARDLTRQGFRNIEITREDGLMKVEAWRGAHELEITYDLSTGAVVKQEMERHPGAPGRVRDRNSDDRGRADDSDDDSDDSDDDDSDDSDDDDSDDSDDDDSDDSDDDDDDSGHGRGGSDDDDSDDDDSADDDSDDDDSGRGRGRGRGGDD